MVPMTIDFEWRRETAEATVAVEAKEEEEEFSSWESSMSSRRDVPRRFLGAAAAAAVGVKQRRIRWRTSMAPLI